MAYDGPPYPVMDAREVYGTVCGVGEGGRGQSARRNNINTHVASLVVVRNRTRHEYKPRILLISINMHMHKYVYMIHVHLVFVIRL